MTLMNSQHLWLPIGPTEDDQTSQFQSGWGGATGAPLLAEELLATDACWGKEGHFLPASGRLSIWGMVPSLCVCRWS